MSSAKENTPVVGPEDVTAETGVVPARRAAPEDGGADAPGDVCDDGLAGSPADAGTGKIRLTVDLTREDHLRLGRWCQEVTAELDRGAVTKSDVVRALLQRMHDDVELARRVKDDLVARGRSARTPKPRMQ